MLTFYQSVLVFAIFVLALTAFYVGKRYPKPGTLPAVLLLIAMSIWDFGYLFGLGSNLLSTKVIWVDAQYLGSVFIPPLWFLVVWRYTQHDLKHHRSIFLLFVIPIFTAAFAWTNHFHGLMWSQAALHHHFNISVLSLTRGPWWLVDTVYSYSLLGGGIYLLLRDAAQLPRIYKKQALVLIAGVSVPLAGNLFYLTGLTHHVDPAPLTFSITGLVLAWGVSRHMLFGVVSVARSKLLDEMNLGMLVMDNEGLLLSMNPAARSYIGCEGVNMGDPINTLGCSQSEFFHHLQDPERIKKQVTIVKDGEENFYEFKLTPLKPENGYTSGWLAQFYDVTSRVRAEKNLREITIETMEALAKTVEAKDAYTREHLDRVEEYSLKLAERLGVPEERREQLRFAAVLHDIGKVRVPNGILNKQDGLTEEEYERMKEHARVGESIVGQVSYLERAARIVGQHHERNDGTGYPRGLSGDKITLEARILSVVDAYDAMRSDRPYREALPKEEAIRELKENKGTQFDPEVVDILLEMIEEGEIEFK
ncbi:HD domain-containing protein [Candidatus Bipolaricaulota bacterium]|nr:HD domain-containing protein [Candidatus Bipolaricaulota bacterium]